MPSATSRHARLVSGRPGRPARHRDGCSYLRARGDPSRRIASYAATTVRARHGPCSVASFPADASPQAGHGMSASPLASDVTSPRFHDPSPEGKRLFSDALEGGTMEGFFSLAPCFQTQSEPAFCGLASLVVVLNALAIDPGRRWKGPWRWFDESMLDCCEPLDKVKAQGITFGKVACLAHCSGADVRPFRANQVTVDDLRRHLIRCASSRDCHLIASYHRMHFKQTGTGHFSPIGGYHAGEDMALILDVACFKYPPHWVPLQLLWEAMNTIDESTGLLRGSLLHLPLAPS